MVISESRCEQISIRNSNAVYCWSYVIIIWNIYSAIISRLKSTAEIRSLRCTLLSDGVVGMGTLHPQLCFLIRNIWFLWIYVIVDMWFFAAGLMQICLFVSYHYYLYSYSNHPGQCPAKTPLLTLQSCKNTTKILIQLITLSQNLYHSIHSTPNLFNVTTSLTSNKVLTSFLTYIQTPFPPT